MQFFIIITMCFFLDITAACFVDVFGSFSRGRFTTRFLCTFVPLIVLTAFNRFLYAINYTKLIQRSRYFQKRKTISREQFFLYLRKKKKRALLQTLNSA